MGLHRRLRLAVMAAAVVVILAALVAYLWMPVRRTGHVAVPAASATPEQVVGAYLAALDVHDCTTAAALSADGSWWCQGLDGLADVTISAHASEDPRDAGRAQGEEVAEVPVTFDLDWRPFHGDGSMGEGRRPWDYVLARASPGAPWRIVDEGTG